MRYIAVPKELTIDEVYENDCSLSSQMYKRLQIENKNCRRVAELLAQLPQSGKEVGSLAYVANSAYQFVRTKAIQSHQFCLDLEISGATAPIKSRDFQSNVGKQRERTIQREDILFVTGGNVGEVALAPDDVPNAVFSSHLLKLDFKSDSLYAYAFLKHDVCKEQVNVGPTGAIAGLDSFHVDYLLDCLIPFPNQPDAADVVAYVEALTRAVMAKEKEIRRKHTLILEGIAQELAANQGPATFTYEDPTVEDVLAVGRMDTNLFTPAFKQKEFLIQNYKHGYSTVENLGFVSSRGQNLQVSAIGQSIYTDTHLPGYYTLMLPKHLSRYGTVEDIEYLGSPKELKTLQIGDIIFGAEGFDKGRSIVILEKSLRTITNIHGITLHHRAENQMLSIFVKCFLDYLRERGLIDLYAVGGNGGSLGLKYWDVIPFPLFPQDIQENLAALYHTPAVAYDAAALTLANFAAADAAFTTAAGITELDRAAKCLRSRLDEVLDTIARDNTATVSFDFLA